MAQQFSDAARSELTAGILAGDTTFTLADGSRFPEANAGTSPVSDANLWFKAVLQDETGFEIVYVRTHVVATTPNTLSNVMRGQEGTTARSFAATSVIGVRLTAFDMESLWTKVATKAADSVALTDAAGTATLPATTAEPVASRLQVLRNNIKQAFADLAGKAADSDVVKLTGAQTVAGGKTFSNRSSHAGAYTPSLTPAHSATPTFDCSASNSFEPGVMTSNVTSLTMSNPVAGQTVQIIRKQDATGGRTHAVPSGAKIDGSINTGANRVSILVMTYYGAGSMWVGNWLQVPA